MYKVLRPVDTNDATRGFWPRYQEPGPLTFLQGVRTLLGPLALLLRPPGIATNLQSLNAENEAGGQSSLMLLCPTKLCIREGSIHWPWMCTCPVFHKLSTPLFRGLIHGSSCFSTPETGFCQQPSAALRRADRVTDRLCRLEQQFFETPTSFRTFHHAVLSPSFPAWELSVTENQSQSVSRSAVPLGC